MLSHQQSSDKTQFGTGHAFSNFIIQSHNMISNWPKRKPTITGKYNIMTWVSKGKIALGITFRLHFLRNSSLQSRPQKRPIPRSVLGERSRLIDWSVHRTSPRTKSGPSPSSKEPTREFQFNLCLNLPRTLCSELTSTTTTSRPTTPHM